MPDPQAEKARHLHLYRENRCACGGHVIHKRDDGTSNMVVEQYGYHSWKKCARKGGGLPEIDVERKPCTTDSTG